MTYDKRVEAEDPTVTHLFFWFKKVQIRWPCRKMVEMKQNKVLKVFYLLGDPEQHLQKTGVKKGKRGIRIYWGGPCAYSLKSLSDSTTENRSRCL